MQTKNYLLLASLLIIFNLLCLPVCHAETNGLDLSDCIKKALIDNPEIREAELGIRIAKSRVIQAEAASKPKVDLLTYTGVVPRARGDAVYSPDSEDSTEPYRHLNMFIAGEMLAIQPIYTFGKITSAKRAAYHGVEVEQGGVEAKRSEIILKVKEYFYGYLLAVELLDLVREVKREVDEAKKIATKLFEKETGTVTELDIFKLNVASTELQKYEEEAKKGIELAKSALKMVMGLPQEEDITIRKKRLEPERVVLLDLEAYIAKARMNRAEFKQIAAGLIAKKALLEMAEAEKLPDLFIAIRVAGAYAPNRTYQDNPFYDDPFRYFHAGPAIGLRWTFDFGTLKAKVESARAEYEQILRKKDFADIGIPLQVKKAYLEVIENRDKIGIAEEGIKNARSWMVSALLSYDMGIGEARDVLEGLAAYAKQKRDYFEAIYHYNTAVAELSKATGEEVAAIEY